MRARRSGLRLTNLHDVAKRAGVERVITAAELSGLLAGSATTYHPAHLSPEDIALLVYTSGTTGPPKGAIILHSNIAFNVEVFRDWMRSALRTSFWALLRCFT